MLNARRAQSEPQPSDGGSPPGPGGLPFAGSALALRRDPLGFFEENARRWGPVVRFRLRSKVVWQVNDPELAAEVLSHESYDKAWSRAGRASGPSHRDVFGNGLVTNTGASWVTQRRIAQPAFHPSRTAVYAAIVPDEVDRLVDGWPSGEVRDLYGEMERLSLRVTATNLFGEDLHARVDEIRSLFGTFMGAYDARLGRLLRLPRWVPAPGVRRFYRAIDRLDGIVAELVAARRRQDRPKDDFLGLLLAARDDSGRPMDERQIRDEIVTMLLAGYETVAHTLSWTMVTLRGSPASWDAVAAEVARLGRAPLPADLAALPLTTGVVKETLRLFPSIWCLNLRVATRDTRLAQWDVPAGTPIFLSTWVLHRDPARFDAPTEFRPERWAAPDIGALPRCSWMPFGAGPRTCIGARLALAECVLGLASLARRGRLEVADDLPIVPKPSFTLRLGRDVPVRWCPR